VRADLVEAVRSNRGSDCERLLDEWFRPETQQALREMVARIKRAPDRPGAGG